MYELYINVCDDLVLNVSFESTRLYERCFQDFSCVTNILPKVSGKIIRLKYTCGNLINENICNPYAITKNLGTNIVFILDSSGCYQGMATSEDVLLKQYAWLIFYVISEHADKEKYIALHAAAVCNSKGAILIAGDKGSGKSTLSYRLVKEYGYRFLGDEFILLKLDEEKIVNVASTIMLQTDKDKKERYNIQCAISSKLKNCFFPILAPMVKTPYIQKLSKEHLIRALLNNRWGESVNNAVNLNILGEKVNGFLLTLGLSIEKNSFLINKIHNEGK